MENNMVHIDMAQVARYIHMTLEFACYNLMATGSTRNVFVLVLLEEHCSSILLLLLLLLLLLWYNETE
jgi:hypothetical protein